MAFAFHQINRSLRQLTYYLTLGGPRHHFDNLLQAYAAVLYVKY